GRDTGHALDALGPPGGDRASYVVPAGGAGGDVVLVDGAGRVDEVERALGQCEVGAGHRLEEQVGAFGGRGQPRVDDDELPAALAQAVEVPRGGWHGLGEVGA